MRQGRGVWFNSTNGWTEYGSFLNDMEDGEMVVKSPIPQSILKVCKPPLILLVYPTNITLIFSSHTRLPYSVLSYP